MKVLSFSFSGSHREKEMFRLNILLIFNYLNIGHMTMKQNIRHFEGVSREK